MILLHVLSNSKTVLEEIAQTLLTERLAIDVNILRDLERLELKDGALKRSKHYRLTAKTKALLFTHIDARLRTEYPDNLPEIYSTAIVHMDWGQADALTKSVQPV